MLSQNRNTIMLTLASTVVSLTSLGGVVNAQQFQYPPSNLAPQVQQYTAPVASQVTKPVANTQVRSTRYAPVAPYPMQRNGYMQQRSRQAPQAMYARPNTLAPSATRTYSNNAPNYGNPYNQYQRVPNSQYNNPYNSYNNRYNTYKSYNNPYNNPYNRRAANNSPFNNFGGGPFNGNNPPWEEWPFGAPDSFWNRKEFPFKDQNPVDWFQPDDPKEGAAVMWDDMIAGPDDLGTMPGGWTVPSISVPNPVDLEDQLEQASKEIPDLIRIYSE